MINFKLLLGLYTSTDKIESSENALLLEYNNLLSFADSDELAHFFQLKKTIESDTFIEKKESIKKISYKESNEFLKESEYLKLSKSNDIINYYKLLKTDLYNNYISILDSNILKRYNELEKIVKSQDFIQKKAELMALKYSITEEYNIEKEFIALDNDKALKLYFKTIRSENYKNYTENLSNPEIELFQKLKKKTSSNEFKELKENLKKLNYKTSEYYSLENEYQILLKSAEIKKYQKFVTSDDFSLYNTLYNSESITKYEELKVIVQSKEFETALADKETFSGSTYELKHSEYLEIEKKYDLKRYYKILSSKELINYNEIITSGKINKLKELELKINSEDFQTKKNYLLLSFNEKWKSTEEYEIDNQHKELSNKSEIIQYFKFIDTKEFINFQDIASSGKVERYEELKQKVQTEEFISFKKYHLLAPKVRWEQSNEYKTEFEFESLSKQKEIVDYFKLLNSKEFKLFTETMNSGIVPQYEELEIFVNSEEFKQSKSYMSLSFEKKWEQTEEYSFENEYNTLIKSDKIKWYNSVCNSPKFNKIKKWKITFSEEFEENKLDKEKWLTRYYWGDTLLNDTYSLSDDKHFITDGKNIEIENSVLSIVSKKEDVMGKSWHPFFGFSPKEFNYTSGLINTGKSFRQKYGKFRAKIKISDNSDITNAFWLVGEKILPQVDIIKYNGKTNFNSFWGNISEKNGVKRSTDSALFFNPKGKFLIFELEWNENALIWRINNEEVRRITEGVPQEEMYLSLSSGIYNEPTKNDFPSTMQIDWVRAYSLTEV